MKKIKKEENFLVSKLLVYILLGIYLHIIFVSVLLDVCNGD